MTALMYKPEAAAEEVSTWAMQSIADTEKAFPELTRALRAAAPLSRIDETAILRTALGAAVGAIFSVLRSDSTAKELDGLANVYLGGHAELFHFENISGERSCPTLRVSLKSSLFEGTDFPLEISKDEPYSHLESKLPSRIS